MSYILDALKKNQAEQAGEGMSLNMAQSQRQTRMPAWVYVVLAALLINGLLLTWFIVQPSEVNKSESAKVAESTSSSVTTAPPTETRSVPTPAPKPIVRSEPAARSTTPPSLPTITEVQYDSLTPAEQVVYDAFSYTSHIFTDVKDLRAIVIDGQRVQIGDSFKGLKIYDITETGVIFEENRRGNIRRVQVSPFE